MRPMPNWAKQKSQRFAEPVRQKDRDRRMDTVADSGGNEVEWEKSFSWNNARTMGTCISSGINIIDGVETDANTHENTKSRDKSRSISKDSCSAKDMMMI